MTAKTGRIVGLVKYSAGDGPEMVIPPGVCQIDILDQDATLGWADGDGRGAATMPLDRYTGYVTAGNIVVDP